LPRQRFPQQASFSQLLERPPDDRFIDRRIQSALQDLRQLRNGLLAIAVSPDESGRAVELMGSVPLLIVDD
jgi:hypothetical protein